jgi:hypothetical protein
MHDNEQSQLLQTGLRAQLVLDIIRNRQRLFSSSRGHMLGLHAVFCYLQNLVG